MPRILFPLLLAASCSTAPTRPAASVPVPAPVTSSPATGAPVPAPSAPPSGVKAPFVCTEVIGLTITAEWYEAGFEQLVDDARFQARTRPHTFVDQWADPVQPGWSEPLTSPCKRRDENPDRVVLFVANWSFTTETQWASALEAFVSTVKDRYDGLRDLELYTVLRGPHNQTCGDPKSVVDPMIDQAIASVAQAHPQLVHAGPKLEAPDCSVFEKGGPHFTADGRKRVAQLLANTL